MFLDDFCNDSQGWGPLNEKNNDLTPCAQSWLIFAPINFVFIIICIPYLNALFRMKSRRIQSSNINTTVSARESFNGICNFDFILSVAFTLAFSHTLILSIILTVINSSDKLNWLIFTLSWQLLSWFAFTCLLYMERKCVYLSGKGEAPSTLVRWFWIIQFLLSLKNLETVLVAKFVNHTQDINAAFYIQIFAVLPFFIIFFRAMTLKTQQTVTNKYVSLPEMSVKLHAKTAEENASLLDILTFGWITDMFSTGYKRRLEMVDLTYLKGVDHTHQTLRTFYKSWRAQLRKTRRKNKKNAIKQQRRHEQIRDHRIEFTDTSSYPSSIMPKHQPVGYHHYTPSLTRAILAAFGSDFFMSLPIALVAASMQFVGPMILRQYLKVAEQFDDGADAVNKAYLYSVLLFGSYMISTILYPQCYHCTRRCGMRVRAALMAACYEKTLRLTQAARSEKTAGQILNIITVDVLKIRDSFRMSWNAITLPYLVSVSLYLIYQQIGSAVFYGLASQVIFLPIMLGIGIKTRKTGIKLQKQRDQRMKVVNEVFCSMKIVKMYSWEELFDNKISELRNGELRFLKIIVWCLVFIIANFSWSSNLICLISFGAYSLIDGNSKLTAEQAFTSIALFNLIRFPLAEIPGTILNLIEAGISLGRIRRFLSANEINDDTIEYADIKKDENESLLEIDEEEKHQNEVAPVISLKNAHFSWDDRGHQMALFDISVNFKPNTMTMIVGETGSGKSGLLRGILGLLTKMRGHVIYGASPNSTKKGNIQIAYSSQVAWIQNKTVRAGILFGSKYEKKFYNAVIRSCALEDDLKMFAAGDQTEIGEKGITLSGGQKQRVALARAVYSQADVYIFDDPLSAVDAEVANHIFNECLIGLLKHKTIILATHAVSFLKHADNILVMEHGTITLQGQLQDLIDEEVNLTKFILHKDKESDQKTEYYDEEKSYQLPGPSSPNYSPKLKAQQQRTRRSSFTKGVGDIIEDEKREEGTVSSKIYWLYVNAAGGICLFLLYVVVFILLSFSNAISLFWLSFWSSNNDTHKDTYFNNKSQFWYLKIYSYINIIALLFIFASGIVMAITRLKASRYLHQKLTTNILRAPMSFFDTTPVGRIINRFARDINMVDWAIPMGFYLTLRVSIDLSTGFVAVVYITPYFIFLLVPLSFAFYYLQKYYITATRELRRLSTLQNSPIYSHFSESIAGVDIIRAFGKIQIFSKKTKQLVDNDHIAYYPSVAGAFWLSIRLQFIANCLVGFVALLCAIIQPSAGYVGVSMTCAMLVGFGFALLVQSKSDLEQDIVSVERIEQYAGNEAVEEKAYIVESNRPKKNWPKKGSITFNKVFMKYRTDLDFVFNGLTFNIKGGEKIGVIGRTGAGKSSLFVSILRIVEIEPDGQIIIDGIDVASIGLRDLRQRISVIPQDPVLFTGTVRFNLDPFQQKSDNQLIEALQLSHCYDALKRMIIEITVKKEKDEKAKEENEKKRKKKENDHDKNGALQSLLNINFSDEKYYDLNPLDIEVEEDGSNFSVGQRQLLCLARAIVRKSKILLLDEATSAVDPQTDQIIQQTIRQVFGKNTILTIAHRIDTILDYDRILIIDNGNVLEFDTPNNLLANKKSKFADIVKASFGVNLESILKK